MHYALLHFCLRVECFDCLWQTLESIHTSYKDVLNSSIAKLGYDPKPELCSFCLGYPHPQYFFDPFEIYSNHQVDGLVEDVRPVSNLHHNGVKIEDGVKPFERAR